LSDDGHRRYADPEAMQGAVSVCRRSLPHWYASVLLHQGRKVTRNGALRLTGEPVREQSVNGTAGHPTELHANR